MKRDHTILLAAGITLGAWTVAARTPPLAQADLAVTRWLQQYASPALDVIFSIITIAGNVEVTVVLTVLIAVALARRGRTQLCALGGLHWRRRHRVDDEALAATPGRPGISAPTGGKHPALSCAHALLLSQRARLPRYAAGDRSLMAEGSDQQVEAAPAIRARRGSRTHGGGARLPRGSLGERGYRRIPAGGTGHHAPRPHRSVAWKLARASSIV